MSRSFSPSSGAGTRTSVVLIALIIVLLVARSGVLKMGDQISDRVRRDAEEAQQKKKKNEENQMEALIGQVILEGYGNPKAQPLEDLVLLGRVINNFALLVKGDNPMPLGSNEEIADALRGKNRIQLVFLPADHRVFNEKGQLVDRWGTPLFFHAEAWDRLDIRSAGPDKSMWTEDDLHRKHDGSFLRGEKLNSASLFDPQTPATR